MKTKLLLLVCFVLSTMGAFAANPAFQDFYGTNGIVIRTNGNKVQVDGSALASTNAVANANIWTNDTVFIRPVAFPTNAMQRNADGSIITGAGVDGYLSTLGLTKTSANYYPLMSVTDTNELDWDFHVGQLVNASLFALGGLSVGGSYTPANSQVNTLLELKSYGPVNNTLVSMEANNLSGNNYASVSVQNPAGTDITLLASEQLGASIKLGSVFAVTNDGNVSLIRNVAYGWPTVQGAAGTVLTNDGAGTLGWGTVSGGGTPAGSTYQVQFNTNNTFGADESFYFVSPSNHLVISNGTFGVSIIQPQIILGGGTDGGGPRHFKFILEDGTNRIVSQNSSSHALLIEQGAIGSYRIDTNTFSPPQNGSTILGGSSNIRWRSALLWTNDTTNLYVRGGTLGAGQLLTDPLGNGEAVWGTNVGNLLVTNITVVNNFTGKGDVYVTNLFIGGANVRTNQYTTNISFTPVLGSLFFGGTVGSDMTNGSRVGMEYIPQRQSFRLGALGPFASISNYWDSTNIGSGSIAMGTNVLAMGEYSISLGMANLIRTNSDGASITGGSNNVMLTNVFFGHIGGGWNNDIGDNHYGGFIGGGTGNSLDSLAVGSVSGGVIAGGIDNRVRIHASAIVGGQGNDIATTGGFIGGGVNNTINSGDLITVAGGEDNDAQGDWSFIGGGSINDIFANATGADALASAIAGGFFNKIGSSGAGADYSFIGGGRTNLIPDVADYCVIGGGSLNQTGGGGNAVAGNTIAGGFNNLTQDQADYAAIGGGIKNLAGFDFTFIPGGVSNNANAALNASIGHFVTNSVTKSVAFGYGTEGGNNRHAFVTTNGLFVRNYAGSPSVGGTYLITNTPIASAGSSETNLQVVTIGAHVLTNNNDRLLVRASGRFAATSNTKQVQLVFGSEDVFDSGAFVANTGAWTLDAEIIRTGNTSQSVNCSFNGGTNVVYVRTSSLDLAQTNGIATVLKITGTASGNGDITNRTLTVEWRPST